MQTTAYLQLQLNSVHQILHDVADDLTAEELTTRILPNTNFLGFDLWHTARTQDWATQTLGRGVPELIDEPRWSGRGRLATHGIGVGASQEQADELARSIALADVLEYADAVHETMIGWLRSISDEDLDQHPDALAHLARYPIYLEPAMRAEVPWMFERPPLWRCLAPGIGHIRDHLAEMDLLKRQLRGTRA